MANLVCLNFRKLNTVNAQNVGYWTTQVIIDLQLGKKVKCALLLSGSFKAKGWDIPGENNAIDGITAKPASYNLPNRFLLYNKNINVLVLY